MSKSQVKDTNPSLKDMDKKSVEKVLKMITNGHHTDDDLAQIYYKHAKKRILFDELNKHGWYMINKYGIWKNTINGRRISRDIIEYITTLVKAAYEIAISKLNSIKSHDKQEKTKKYYTKNYEKLLKSIKNHNTHARIIKLLEQVMPEERVFEKFDTINGYIFAFNNGVYDLKTNEFRNALPEELVTITCGYDYIPPDDKKVSRAIKHLEKVFDSIFENKEDSECCLTQIARKLCTISLEEALIWRGSGGNGKGVVMQLIRQTFGKYFGTIPIEYLSQSKHGVSATSADEVMASKKFTRIAFVTEPESNMKLRQAKIKALIGSDPVSARFLYGSNFEFVPHFLMIIPTNFVIEFENAGKDIVRRIKSSKFPFNFVDEPVLDIDRPIDRTLKEKLAREEYKVAFFHVLLKRYQKWMKNNRQLILSPNFQEETEIVLYGYDKFSPFYNEYIRKTDDNTFLSLAEIQKACKSYGIEMSQSEIQKAVEAKGFVVKRVKGYNGIRGAKLIAKQVAQEHDDIDALGM